MKRGLLFSAFAFVVSALFGADPVGSWENFNTLTSGNFTINLNGGSVETETGVAILSSSPLTMSYSGSDYRQPAITILAQIESVPTEGDVRIASFNSYAAGNNWCEVFSSGTTISQGFTNSSGGTLTTRTDYGVATTWTPSEKQWVAVTYSNSTGTYTYLDGALKVSGSALVSGGCNVNLATIALGRSASGMKVHKLYIYASKLSTADILSKIAPSSSEKSATLSATETAWENISWDNSSAPEKFDSITFTISGDTTLTNVPKTIYNALKVTGTGTLKLLGETSTLTVLSLTAEDGVTALDTTGLTVANSAISIPSACVWTMGDQTLTSYSGIPTTLIIKGETTYTGSGGNSGILSDRTVTVSGSGAVFKTTIGDSTGYTTAGTALIAKDGGTISFGERETFITPLTLCGGTLKTTGGSSSRGIDFWYKTENPKVWITPAEGATLENPTISHFIASDTSNNGRKFLIRDGKLTISVAEKAQLNVDAVFYTNGDHTFTKQGAGAMVLECASTINSGSVSVAEGTLKLKGGVTGTAPLTISEGATVEFDAGTDGTITPKQTISGAGTLKLTSGTVDLRNVTAGSTVPAITFAEGSTATLLLSTTCNLCTKDGTTGAAPISISETVPENAKIYLVLTDAELRSSYTLPTNLVSLRNSITLCRNSSSPTPISTKEGTMSDDGTFTASPNTWSIGESTETTSFSWTDTTHWSYEAIPGEGTPIIIEVSNNITLTDVPATEFDVMKVTGSDTLTLVGATSETTSETTPTLNVSALTVGDSITALDTSALTIATKATVTIPATCTWTMGKQTLNGTNFPISIKSPLIIKGKTEYTASDRQDGTGIASGRTITVSGSGAVFSTKNKDATGWGYTAGQMFTATDSGTISFGNRETFITPVTLCGGTLKTTGVDTGRTLDFYYGGGASDTTTTKGGITVNATEDASAENPTVSYITASGPSGNDNAKKIMMRSGPLAIFVAKNAQLDVDALLYSNPNDGTASGQAGKLVKSGEGTLVLKCASDISKSGVDVTAGTLLLDGNKVVTGTAALTVSSGATVEFDAGTDGTIAPAQTISGAGTLKLTSGTVDLRNVTKGDTVPAITFAEGSTATLLLSTTCSLCTKDSTGAAPISISGTVPSTAKIYLVLSDAELRSTYTLPTNMVSLISNITLCRNSSSPTPISTKEGTMSDDGTFTASPNTWSIGESTETTSFSWTDTSHWSYKAIPDEGASIIVEVSGDITLTDVPATTFGILEAKGSGTLTLVGATSETTSETTPTLNVSAFTVGSGITALDTSALKIATTPTFADPTTCTCWAMNSQTLTSYANIPKTLVIKGATTYNSGTVGFAKGRSITVSGSGASFTTTAQDATGWTYDSTSGQSLTATDGGKISFESRETFVTPLVLCGGTLETVNGQGGRAIDFFASTNVVTVEATTDATATNPTVSTFQATKTGDAELFLLRNGDLAITVEDNARLDVDAKLTTTILIDGSTPGKLVKKGAGTLVLKRAGTINITTKSQSGVSVTEGTLVLKGGVTGTAPLTISEGATVEIGCDFAPSSQTISGAGTLKLTSGTVNLTGITLGDTVPTVTFSTDSTAILLLSTGSKICDQASFTVPETASIHLILTEEQLKKGYTLPDGLMAVKDRIIFYKDADTEITAEDGTVADGTFTANDNWTLGDSSETSFKWSDTSHWSSGSVPVENGVFILYASGDSVITITDVPETAFGTMRVKGSGTIKLVGTTLNVSSASVESGATLNTEGLKVATGNVAVAGTWVSGEATLTGTVTGSGAFTVNSGSVSLDTLPATTLSAITVNADASLAVTTTFQDSFSFRNLAGAGTFSFSMVGSVAADWSHTFTLGSGFTGTTNVTAGWFTLESSTFGSKLVLSGNAAWQVNTAGATISKDIDFENTSAQECHVNSTKSATFTGTVTGTGFTKGGAGSLTLQGDVELDTLVNNNNSSTLNLQSDAKVTTLTCKAGTLNLEGKATVTTLTCSGGTLNLKSDATIDTLTYSGGTLSISTGEKKLSIKEVTNIASAGVTVPSGVTFEVGKLNRSGKVTFASGSTLKPHPDYKTPTLVAGDKNIALSAGSTLDLTEKMFTVNGNDKLGLPDSGTVTVKVAKAGQLLSATKLSTSDAEKFTLEPTGTTLSLFPAVKTGSGLYALEVPVDSGDTTTEAAAKEAIAKEAAAKGVITITEVTAVTGCVVNGAELFDGVITVEPNSEDATKGTVTVKYTFGISKMSLTKSEDDKPVVTICAQIRGEGDVFATITSTSELILEKKAIGAEDSTFAQVTLDDAFEYNSSTGTYSASATGIEISNVVFRVVARTKSTSTD